MRDFAHRVLTFLGVGNVDFRVRRKEALLSGSPGGTKIAQDHQRLTDGTCLQLTALPIQSHRRPLGADVCDAIFERDFILRRHRSIDELRSSADAR